MGHRVHASARSAALADAGREHGLRLHMDGARLANAIAQLGCTPAEATWQAGVDVLSFGATKNGALAAEAVIFFDPALAAGFERRRKRAGQLWSKLRYMSAQLLAMLEDDLWLRHGAAANGMAARIAQGLARVAGARLVQPAQANEVFAALPQAVIDGLLAEGFDFYPWPAPPGENGSVVRLVTSWVTRPEEVDAFLGAAERSRRPDRRRFSPPPGTCCIAAEKRDGETARWAASTRRWITGGRRRRADHAAEPAGQCAPPCAARGRHAGAWRRRGMMRECAPWCWRAARARSPPAPISPSSASRACRAVAAST